MDAARAASRRPLRINSSGDNRMTTGLAALQLLVIDDNKQMRTIVGSVLLEPTPADLSIWLPRILGATASGSTFALASTLPSFRCPSGRPARAPRAI